MSKKSKHRRRNPMANLSAEEVQKMNADSARMTHLVQGVFHLLAWSGMCPPKKEKKGRKKKPNTPEQTG